MATLTPETIYTPQEIADALKVALRTVYDLIHEGRLKALKAGPKGRIYRITQAQFDEFLKNGGQEPATTRRR